MRSYGRLEAQVEQLHKAVEALTKDVHVMRNLMEQGRGGWRTLAWLGGVMGTLGGIIAWLLSHIKVAP